MKELRLRLHFIVFLLAPDSQPEAYAAGDTVAGECASGRVHRKWWKGVKNPTEFWQILHWSKIRLLCEVVGPAGIASLIKD
jgi:hypothetical protein